MFKFVCSMCGTEYHPDFVKNWGKTQESAGYGNRPVCTALVTDNLGSGSVCRGTLVPVPCTQAELDALPRPKPIAL